MGLLAPIFLTGALAAAIPIVLHLLKREPEARVRFAAVRLLRRARVEHADRRHLRELLLLALRVAAVLALAIAFARPFFSAETSAASGRVTVVALDTSLSVSAPGQFERARQLAHEAVERASGSDRLAVLTFADAADVVVRPTSDRALVRAAIDRAAAGAGATHYRGALAAASELLGGTPGTIVVVTDLQASGWDEGDRVALPVSVHLEVADVGAPPPNLAVTAVQAEGDRVLASVRNLGDAPRDTTLRISMHDEVSPSEAREVGTSPASVGPGQTVRVALAPESGTLASVSLEDTTGVQADNTRFLVLDDTGRPTVLVVTATGDLAREAFYLQQALSVAGGRTSYAVDATGTSPSVFPDALRLRTAVAVVLTSTRGLDRQGRERLAEYVKSGGGLFVAAGQDVDAAVTGELLGDGAATLMPMPTDGAAGTRSAPAPRTLAPEDLRHPLFRAFDGNAAALGLPRFARISNLGGPCPVLARFTSGDTALVECAVGGGRVLVFASDLDGRWNNFPRHTAFLPFVQEAVQYLAGPRSSTAAYTVGDVPAGVSAAPGFVQVSNGAGGRRRWAAVNVSPAEVDPARMSAEEFGAAVTRSQEAARTEGQIGDRQLEERQNIWQYLLAAMLAIMAIESLVGMRAS